MRVRASIAGVLLLIPAVGEAQQRRATELGTGLGASILTVDGETRTRIGAPGMGMLGQPTLYATFFDASVMIQTELVFTMLSGGGSTATLFGLGAQVGHLFSDPAASSAYVAGNIALVLVSSGGSESDYAPGARVGYRFVVGEHFAVRLEAGFRRWLDSETNEITIGLGLGAVFRKD